MDVVETDGESAKVNTYMSPGNTSFAPIDAVPNILEPARRFVAVDNEKLVGIYWENFVPSLFINPDNDELGPVVICESYNLSICDKSNWVNHLIMVRYVSQPTIIDINLMRKTSLKK